MNLNEAIHAAIDARLAGLNTCMPARVESYDAARRRADVKPLIKGVIDGVAREIPVIPAVPVVFPWGGNASLKFPIDKGASGVVLFSQVSMERWLANGSPEPISDRFNDLSDGIFLPGMAPFNVEEPAGDRNALVLKLGNVKVRLATGVAIGTAQVELLDIINQILLALQTTTVATAVGTYPLIYSGAPIGIEVQRISALLAIIREASNPL